VNPPTDILIFLPCRLMLALLVQKYKFRVAFKPLIFSSGVDMYVDTMKTVRKIDVMSMIFRLAKIIRNIRNFKTLFRSSSF